MPEARYTQSIRSARGPEDGRRIRRDRMFSLGGMHLYGIERVGSDRYIYQEWWCEAQTGQAKGTS